MNSEEIKEVLRLHGMWLRCEFGGKRADLAGANLTCAYLADASLAGADLTRADLAGANLTCAYLADASLAGADLTRANLTDASLEGADLTGADLTGADLTGANLTGANGFPKIKRINNFRSEILAAVVADGCSINMSRWHVCETVHCLAGWIVTKHPEGALLESIYGTGSAAALILNACGEKIPNFYDTKDGCNERALNWLKTGKQENPTGGN